MALVKRGSRLITVDGIVYRWRVRKHPARPTPLSFAIERADRRGAVLLANMPATNPADWTASPGVPMVPYMVAALVRQGYDQGWRPETAGPAFQLRVGAEIWSHPAPSRAGIS